MNFAILVVASAASLLLLMAGVRHVLARGTSVPMKATGFAETGLGISSLSVLSGWTESAIWPAVGVSCLTALYSAWIGWKLLTDPRAPCHCTSNTSVVSLSVLARAVTMSLSCALAARVLWAGEFKFAERSAEIAMVSASAVMGLAVVGWFLPESLSRDLTSTITLDGRQLENGSTA